MHLQSLQVSSPTFAFGTPVVPLHLPHAKHIMDIGNLLNTKSPKAPSRSPSGSISSHLNHTQLGPGSYSHRTGPPSESSFDSRSQGEDFMAQYSPQPVPRPQVFPPPTGPFQDSSQYPNHTPGSEPSSASSQLPYDPIGDRHRAAAAAAQQGVQMSQQRPSADGSASGDNDLPKAFACSVCSKGFARRSDLVRHERIHSGIRPHVCTHPGCGKQFIQRSALTVHERVHTREKPHLCEKCGKPFSDSSSLARHRRIHSGQRPYQCPYADCQKTFTRRTTLTRHQNHHTGTFEEAEAARAAALASQASRAQAHMPQASGVEKFETAEPEEQSDASSSTASYNYMAPMTANMGAGRPGAFQPQATTADYYPPSGPKQNPYPGARSMQPSRSQSDTKTDPYPPGPPGSNATWSHGPGPNSRTTGGRDSPHGQRVPNAGENYGYQGAPASGPPAYPQQPYY